MAPDGRKKIEELFARALDLDQEDRQEFLGRECGDDDPLRSEVLQLLGLHQRADQDDFLRSWSRTGGGDGPSNDPSGVPTRYVDLRAPRPGGMGVVYRARDVELGRDVAYKVMKDAFGDPDEFRRRFAREAEITARLQYPGIVPVFGMVTDGSGRPGYAMGYIDGENLHELVKRPGVLRERLSTFLAACRIVEHAHKTRFVHGDLSLKNVMVADDGATHVVDWGLARCLDPDDALNQPGGAPSPGPIDPFTPAFAAPSVRDGGPRTLTTDVYSLGAVLAGLVLGVKPNGAPDLAILDRRDVPRALRAIIKAAMLGRDDGPYPDAGALGDDIGRFLNGERVRADIGEPWRERAWRSTRRHPARATLAIASILLVSIASTSASLVVAARASVAEKIQESLRLAAEGDSARERAARLDAEAKHFRELALENQLVAAVTGGDAFRSRSGDPSAIAYEQLLPLLQVIQLTASHPKVRKLASDLIGSSQEGAREMRSLSAELETADRRILERRVRAALQVLEELGRDHPGRPDLPWRRAFCELTLAHLETARELGTAPEALLIDLLGKFAGQHPRQARFDELLARLDKGLDTLSKVSTDGTDPERIRLIQIFSLDTKALMQVQLGRYSEALVSFDRSLGFVGGKEPRLRNDLRKACLLAAEEEQAKLPWSRRGDHGFAIRMADYLANNPDVSDAAIYNAACAHALASLDQGAPAEERERRAQRAVALLDRVAESGYFDGEKQAGELIKDPDLGALRPRGDFRALAARVAKGG